MGTYDWPVYSGIEAGEEMVEPFSQSLSPFIVIDRPGDMCRAGECERLEEVTKDKSLLDLLALCQRPYNIGWAKELLIYNPTNSKLTNNIENFVSDILAIFYLRVCKYVQVTWETS